LLRRLSIAAIRPSYVIYDRVLRGRRYVGDTLLLGPFVQEPIYFLRASAR